MTAAVWFLQVGYAGGFVCLFWAGSCKRWRRLVGWACGAGSEAAFAAWATLGHVPSAYPWIAAWLGVYVYNWVKGRTQGDAVPGGREATHGVGPGTGS